MIDNAEVPLLDRTVAHLMASHGLADSPRLPLLVGLAEDAHGIPRTRIVDLPPTPPDTPLDRQLDDLTRRVTAGQPLSSSGMPLPPLTGLLVLHEELPGPPGQPVVYRVIDAVDVTGHTAVASARPGHPATAVYHTRHTRRRDPVALRHLLYAATGDRRLEPEPGRLLTAAWHAVVQPANHTMPSGTAVDDPHGVAFRALALAGALDDITTRRGLAIDWQQATITAAVDPDQLRVWLFKAAELLAADLWQVLIAASWEQVTGLADVAVVLTESDHLANLATAVHTATGARTRLLEHLTTHGDQLNLIDELPADTDRPETGD